MAQVLEQIQPALPRADQVQVDVDGGELKARAGGAGREILEGEALLDLSRRAMPSTAAAARTMLGLIRCMFVHLKRRSPP